MMKKLFLCSMLIACSITIAALSESVYAEDELIWQPMNVSSNDNYESIFISGGAPQDANITAFIVSIENDTDVLTLNEDEIEEGLCYVDNTVAVSDQTFYLEGKPSLSPGYYAVILKCQQNTGNAYESVGSIYYSDKIRVLGDNDLQDIAQTVRGLTSGNALSVLTDTELTDALEAIGMHIRPFLNLNSAMQTDVVNAFISAKSADMTTNELSKAFNGSFYLSMMNNAESAEDMLEIARDNQKIGVNLTQPRLQRDDINLEVIFNALYAKRPFKSLEELDSMITNETVLYIFNNLHWGVLMGEGVDTSELTKNRDVLTDVNFTAYAALSNTNQKTLWIDVDSKTFTSINELTAFINSEINKLSNPNVDIPIVGGVRGNSTPSSTFGTASIHPSVKDPKDNFEQESKPDGVFYDIADAVWAKPAIEYMNAKGIVSGDGNGRFRPNESVTREEFVKMVVSAFEMYNKAESCSFIDVDADDWYYDYILQAQKYDIIQGYDDGRFGVGEKISREDAVCIIARAVRTVGTSLRQGEKIVFDDADEIQGYAKDEVEYLAAAGVINGKDDGRFAPKEKLTRAESAQILYKILTQTGDDTNE